MVVSLRLCSDRNCGWARLVAGGDVVPLWWSMEGCIVESGTNLRLEGCGWSIVHRSGVTGVMAVFGVSNMARTCRRRWLLAVVMESSNMTLNLISSSLPFCVLLLYFLVDVDFMELSLLMAFYACEVLGKTPQPTLLIWLNSVIV
ncbi:unnamed protein product [Vicia faba]|uniref:Uncharacterized protein n=1 Tax=Vicia faba TaxID=3906 RepID=A0AAV0ZTL0_VICFA|nr:unnamed protein product [Vicia faba]